MRIENNIIYGDPIEDVPNISFGQRLLDQLRENADEILQIEVDSGKHFTYKDVLEKSTILATAFRNYGINVEDRISICSENHANYVIVLCSTLFVGATFAPLNPAYTERECRHMLEIFQPRVMFVSRRTEKLLLKIAPTLSWTMKLIQLDDESVDGNTVTLNELLERHNKDMWNAYTYLPVEIDDNSKRMAAIFCSSGTTGFPKGVALSHRNLLAYIRTFKIPALMNTRRGDRTLLFLPMFHGYAFGLINMTICGGSSYCLMSKFALETLIECIEKYRITHLPLVPSVLIGLAKHPMLEKHDFSSVKELLCGAAPLPKHVADQVKKRTGIKYIRNGYGMTELTIVSNISERGSTNDTVGRILPSFKCKIVDTRTGKTLGPREIGEVCFAGDQVMLGYFRNPKITAETIDKENWLHTGDLGYFDEEGLLYITGRIKELIKYKGFQVSPSEIEALLMTHPAVMDAAVIGIADQRSGEIPMALVVRKPGSNVTAKEIEDFVKMNMSPQKWLRGGTKFIEAVPKTPSGKIIRRELANLTSKL